MLDLHGSAIEIEVDGCRAVFSHCFLVEIVAGLIDDCSQDAGVSEVADGDVGSHVSCCQGVSPVWVLFATSGGYGILLAVELSVDLVNELLRLADELVFFLLSDEVARLEGVEGVVVLLNERCQCRCVLATDLGLV